MNVRVERTISQSQSYRLLLAPLTMRNCVLLNRFFSSSSSSSPLPFPGCFLCPLLCECREAAVTAPYVRETLDEVAKNYRNIVCQHELMASRGSRAFLLIPSLRLVLTSLRYALSNFHKKMVMARDVTQNSLTLANGIA